MLNFLFNRIRYISKFRVLNPEKKMKKKPKIKLFRDDINELSSENCL